MIYLLIYLSGVLFMSILFIFVIKSEGKLTIESLIIGIIYIISSWLALLAMILTAFTAFLKNIKNRVLWKSKKENYERN